MKNLFRILLKFFFRFRSYNEYVLHTRGPVLLIPNHTSWLDWLFLWSYLDDDWKFVTSSITAQASWLHQKIMVNRWTFPIDTASPYAVKRMAEFLQQGGRLVLFAEGRLSLTGTLMKLFDGTGFLLFKTHAKVITCYLRGAKRLLFSPNNEKKLILPEVTVHFSDLLEPPTLHDISTTRAREILTSWLRAKLLQQQFDAEMHFGPQTLLQAISDTAAMMPAKVILEDALSNQLNYRKLLIGADLLSQELAKVIPATQVRVGVLLPNINATPLVLIALWKLGKVPALLNFSTGTSVMMACSDLAGLKYVISSRNFVQRARLEVKPFTDAGITIIQIEDIRSGIGGAQKLLAALRQWIFSRLDNPALRPEDTCRRSFHQRL